MKEQWERFLATGKVQDYLTYRYGEAATAQEKQRGVGQAEGKSSNDLSGENELTGTKTEYAGLY